MTEMTEMANILASFSSLNIVKNSGREESKTNWASDGHREISDDNDDNDDNDEVLNEHREVPSAPSPVVSSPVANATARLGKFDYGIMARCKTAVKNHAHTLSSEQHRLNHLPKEFMLASNMLSIRDPWEDAAASGYFDLKKKKNWMNAPCFWVIILCIVAVGCSVIWAHYSGACTGLQSAICQYGHCYMACRIISYFRQMGF